MSMDGVDLLSNELASVSLVLICDENGAAKNDRVECLDTNQPMSTDGSLRSSDSELNARGPQRRDPKYAVRNTPPYVYGTTTNDTTQAVVTDINTGYRGNFLSVLMPRQQVVSAFPEPFNIADNLIDASENNGVNGDMNQISSSERFLVSYSSFMAVGATAAAKSSQFTAIEMSPDPAETSPSSRYVSSQGQNRWDSVSMTSDDANWADILNMIREDTKQGDSINSSQKKNNLQLNCNTDVLSPVSTPSTYDKIRTTNGLEWQYPPTECRQNNNGAISYNAHPQPNILWAQAGDVTTHAFLQNNKLPMRIATATDRGYVSTQGHNQPTSSGVSNIPILDLDPQANQLSPKLAIEDSHEMVPLAYQPTQFPSGASDQIAMASAILTQAVFSNEPSAQMVDTQLLYPNETTSQTNNSPLSYSYRTPHNSNGIAKTPTPFPQQTLPNVISAQTNAPPSYPNAWHLDGTSVQMTNAVQYQHQPLCYGTGGQITWSQVSYPQPPANGISGHIVMAQQYKQPPPPHGLSCKTSVPISHPQTHIGPSGQIVKRQGMINNISVNLDGASETPSQTYPPKTAPMIPHFGSQPTHLSHNLRQSFLPEGSVAHDNGLLVSSSSQVSWQETIGNEPAVCMTTGLVANQVTPVAQSSQVIPQAFLINTNGSAVLISSSNQLFQSGASPMVNACRQVFPVAGTNYQAGLRQLLPKSVAQQSSVSVSAQPGRKPRDAVLTRNDNDRLTKGLRICRTLLRKTKMVTHPFTWLPVTKILTRRQPC
ncbi:uncharacterized protein LOC127861249 isoform X2 [Dreissena polymorpha]|nr:uncharacterized protein LOC127861249 isoform X2 [Dreissena polymorpha]XP_052255631.1 uncharacterized protein LOC127861249 isoform X2 [Dreissena polymorpha]